MLDIRLKMEYNKKVSYYRRLELSQLKLDKNIHLTQIKLGEIKEKERTKIVKHDLEITDKKVNFLQSLLTKSIKKVI